MPLSKQYLDDNLRETMGDLKTLLGSSAPLAPCVQLELAHRATLLAHSVVATMLSVTAEPQCKAAYSLLSASEELLDQLFR